MASASLQTTLAPLMIFLNAENIQEIMINRPHELWLDDGVLMSRHTIDLSFKMLKRLVDLIAAQTGQEFKEHNPMLSAMLPGGHRIQVVMPPAAKMLDEKNTWQDTVSLSIRKQTRLNFSLYDFEKQGGFSKIGIMNKRSEESLSLHYQNKHYLQLLLDAVRNKKTMLISGGTYSGKTTLLNMLIKEIDKEERIICIEDTPELELKHENQVRLFYSRGMQGAAKVNVHDLLTATLRLRPDRIIMGELRDDDAVCWLQAANTGHEGTLSSIHSDTPALAIQKLIDMVKIKYPFQSDESVRQYIHAVVDMIIQVKRDRHTGQRFISEILVVR